MLDLHIAAMIVRNTYTSAEQAEHMVNEIRKHRVIKADDEFFKTYIIEHLTYWMTHGKDGKF